ncbi:MAG: hypothetical protein P8R42_23665 [Candidatus Binatia bacterium]|nr:hypothetical protein [Candidatus Binatia bacterium]
MSTMRFNHMELTFPVGELDDTKKDEIRTFYDEILGWKSLDVPILGQQGLLLQVDDTVSQFILLMESPNPIRSPGYDHLGLLMEDRGEVDELLEKCRTFQKRDDRVQIKEYKDLDQGAVVVHAFYVKYLLPIWFDIQNMEWQAGAEPQKTWKYA